MKKDISDLKQVVKNIMRAPAHASVHPTVSLLTIRLPIRLPQPLSRVITRGYLSQRNTRNSIYLTIGDNKVRHQDATEYEESTKSISEVEKR